MGLFSRSSARGNAPADINNPELLADLNTVYLGALNKLLSLVRESVGSSQGVEVEALRAAVDDLRAALPGHDSPKRLSLTFEREGQTLGKLIADQQRAQVEREKELTEIIDLLTENVSSADLDNSAFYQRISDHGAEMLSAARLDDVRKLRVALESSAGHLDRMVEDKRAADAQQIAALTVQVEQLKSELNKVRKVAETDGLTGVLNRKSMDEILVDLSSKAAISRRSFAFLLIDIDNFKQLNDTYGHQIGDRVLIAFARKCYRMLRADDYLARYGGEEFAVILPDASLRNAVKKARRICEAVAGTRYAIGKASEEQYLSVTVSIGVSALRRTDSIPALIERADKALYLAKRTGKNKAMSEEDL